MSGLESVPPPILTQGAGYGVVIGLGGMFALGMALVTRQLYKVFGEKPDSSETFMVADRSVGTGLTASAIISAWMYPTALISSPYMAYSMGVSAPIWFAAGQSTMIAAFGYVAIKTKLRAPTAHTMLELIKIRYGTFAHWIWICLALINNALNFSTMMVGVSNCAHALTGMSPIAVIYLIPIGVSVYTAIGGLRATYLTDYVHTTIALILLLFLVGKTLQTVGSLDRFFFLITEASKYYPVTGNERGSFLTMTSRSGVFFGINHFLSNSALVALDTGFWQKAFSADVSAAVPGYITGGNFYFSIPWLWGTVIGLGALALEQAKFPLWPTYPNRMTSAEVNGGLVGPYLAQAVAGKGGGAAWLLIIFMTSTSVTSAQLIASGSILSYDIYGTYVNKQRTDSSLIRASHFSVFIASICYSTLSLIWYKINLDVNFLVYFYGIVVCPGLIPTCFAVLWKKQTKLAAISSILIGIGCGLAVWLSTAYKFSGELTVASTQNALATMYGVLTSTFVPLPITIAVSYTWPHNWDWDNFLNIKIAAEAPVELTENSDEDGSNENNEQEVVEFTAKNSQGVNIDHARFGSKNEKRISSSATSFDASNDVQDEKNGAAYTVCKKDIEQPDPDVNISFTNGFDREKYFTPARLAYMKKMAKISAFWAVFTFIGQWVLWPLPMYGSHTVFSLGLWRAWIVVAFIWFLLTVLVAVIYPLVDGGAQQIKQVVIHVFK